MDVNAPGNAAFLFKAHAAGVRGLPAFMSNGDTNPPNQVKPVGNSKQLAYTALHDWGYV